MFSFVVVVVVVVVVVGVVIVVVEIVIVVVVSIVVVGVSVVVLGANVCWSSSATVIVARTRLEHEREIAFAFGALVDQLNVVAHGAVCLKQAARRRRQDLVR